MKKIIKDVVKIGISLLLSGVILWWMYRDFDWQSVREALAGEMSWMWMLLSFPFGISAQVFRAMRWRQALEPMGEKPRLHTSVNAIFLSYASSLVVPRVGEFLRCGVLRRYDGVNFSRSIGTVVCERVVDMLMVLLLAVTTVLLQIPVFTHFFATTGVTMDGFLSRFSAEGYWVTAVCGLLALSTIAFLAHRLNVFGRTKSIIKNLMEGLMSIRFVRNKTAFILNSIGIWASYYLHFYLTFYCFHYTEDLGATCALVAFVVGCFAVLVPTPNGAGPWHFAVKTILMLYGVGGTDGAIFVLIVHTIQTLLVLALGVYALVALSLIKPLPKPANED